MCKYLKAVLKYVRIILDKIIDILFGVVWNCQKKPIPDLDKKHAILAESAVSLARKVKNGELLSEDLVKAVIERMKLVNPIINAMVEDRFEAALEEAREVDRRLAAGITQDELKKKPFLGIPFTSKESQAAKGMRLTLGLWSRRNERATEDSEAIRLMKEAGAILLATTNLPELLIWQETRNMLYGMSRNPHHTGRTPGGSSGAEAALTATYATPISLCTDVGGSTRMPAFYCGLFGYHPTANVTNLRGVLFREGTEDSMLCLGFISKHVEDLAPLMSVVAGSKVDMLGLDRDVNIEEIKFYYTESSDDCHLSSMSPELKTAMSSVVTKLKQDLKTSHAPEPYYHEAFDHMYSLWNHWMSREPDDFGLLYTDRKFTPVWYKEMVKKLFCSSRHALSAIVRLTELQLLPSPDRPWAEELTQKLKDDLFGKLDENGVLLFPSAPQAAPYHYSAFLRPYNFAYWALINVLKCPAVQVPLGRNESGLPLGIQVVAAPGRDALCLAAAAYLQEHFGGSIMACNMRN